MADEKQVVAMEQGASTPKTLEELKNPAVVDTVHQDEALRVQIEITGDLTWTPEEEKKLVRRIDKKLLTLLIITYGLQYYDKAMLSQAVSILSTLLFENIQLTSLRRCLACARTCNSRPVTDIPSQPPSSTLGLS